MNPRHAADAHRSPPPPSAERAREILAGAARRTVVVAGDFFLDRYLLIDRRLAERSLETGLEAHQVVQKRHSPGAAGSMTNNLRALAVGRVLAVGFTGRDGEGLELRAELARRGVVLDHLVEWEGVFTPTYTKPMVTGDGLAYREIERQDIKNRQGLPAGLRAALRAALEAAWASADGLLVSDQVEEEGCGVWDETLRKMLAGLARGRPQTPVLADSRAHIGLFRDVMLKPNEREARTALGLPDATAIGALLGPLEALRRARGDRQLYLTRGAEGMALLEPGETAALLPAIRVKGEIDIVGAGDATAAGIMTGWVGGADAIEAGWLGQTVASITIQQIGTTGTASPAQVEARLADLASGRPLRDLHAAGGGGC